MFEWLKNCVWSFLTVSVPRYSPKDLTPRFGNPPREVKSRLLGMFNAIVGSHMSPLGLIALQFRSYRAMVIEQLRPIGRLLASIEARFPSRKQPGIEMDGRVIDPRRVQVEQ